MKKILEYMTVKRIYITMLVVFVASVIPILALAFYNYPCADDFSASDTVHLAWVNTGSIMAVIKAAWENVVFNYMEWSGVFMSVFWTSLQPGIFGERYYGIITVLTVIFMTAGGFYLGHVIFDKYLKADKYISRCIVLLYLFVSIQCMPDGNEGLYWHAGVVNYTWAFAFLLLLLGLLLSIYLETNSKKKSTKTVFACILAVCVGGGNFITALQGSIWLLLFVLIVCGMNCYKNKKKVWETIKQNIAVILPTIIIIGSFAASVLAPGNKVRMGYSVGFGAVKSILISFYYLLYDPLRKWITWPVIMSLAVAIPFMWQIIKKTKYSYKYPAIPALLGFCLASAAYTPSLYAQGNAGAGRQDNTVFLIWTVILYAVIFYIVGWLYNILEVNPKKKDAQLSERTKIYIVGMAMFWLVFSGLAVMIDESAYIGTSAGYSIVSGQAEMYRDVNEYRLELLRSEEKNIVVPSFSNPPELLIFEDITGDPAEWLNRAMAEYYGKESVRRE